MSTTLLLTPARRGPWLTSDRPDVRFHWRWIRLGWLIAFVAWAFVPFAISAAAAAQHHRIFLGVDGPYPWDGLQYLAWARDAAEQGLIRNLFGSAHDSAVFVHPIWTLTGLLDAVISLGPAVVMGFWKSISAVVLVAGCGFLVCRHIPAQQVGRRSAALVLCLLGGLTPLVIFLRPAVGGTLWLDLVHAGVELVPAASLWGYAPLAIALGLMPIALDGIERVLAGGANRRLVGRTTACALLISWLHPWQGETLAIVGAALALWQWLEGSPERRAAFPQRSLAVIAAGFLAPLVYYLTLSRFDAGWATAQQLAALEERVPFQLLVVGVIPLAIIALVAGRVLVRDRSVRGLLLWPMAALLITATSWSDQCRALNGLAIPTALLAVKAWPAWGSGLTHRVAALVGCLAVVAPFGWWAANSLPAELRAPNRDYAQVRTSDARAARLAAARSGGRPVLAPIVLGTAIPVLTGMPTWVGHPIWTPNYFRREGEADQLFRGQLSASAALRLVISSRAQALVQPCGFGASLETALSRLQFTETRVGCARVYARPARAVQRNLDGLNPSRA